MTRVRPLRWLGRLLLGLIAVQLLYFAAATIGGMIPANAQWKEAGEGIRVYVADNGVHTDLILPVAAEGVDWRDLVRPGDIRDSRYAGLSHLAFGWGDRAFYLETPDWGAIRPGTALKALFGSDGTVLHIAHMPEPRPGPKLRAVMLRPDEYRRLAAYVRATFATGPDGRAAPIPGYGAADAFYAARGRYSPLSSCNEWTGRGLRTAGVRTGAWTPLAFSVMFWR